MDSKPRKDRPFPLCYACTGRVEAKKGAAPPGGRPSSLPWRDGRFAIVLPCNDLCGFGAPHAALDRRRRRIFGRTPVAICNTDIVSQAYRALQSRDLAGLTALLAPDHVFEQSDELPWGGRFFGVAGFLDFFRRLNQYLDSTPSIDTMIGAGTRVAVAGRTKGTVRGSGAAFDVPFVHVFELRDGRIVHGSAMIDHAVMLAALSGEDKA